LTSGRDFFGSRFWEGGTTILMGSILQKKVDFLGFGGSGVDFGVRGSIWTSRGSFRTILGPPGGPWEGPFWGPRGSILGSRGSISGPRGWGSILGPRGRQIWGPRMSILGCQNDKD
jgi:hypothetical protein